jgi:putative ATP-binding cassette transporter
MFLPQRPYMVLGNLRDQMTYPHLNKIDEPELDAQLTRILQDLDMKHVLDRVGSFEVVLNWEDVLSLGSTTRRSFTHV